MSNAGQILGDVLDDLRPKGDRWRGCLAGDFSGNVDAPLQGWKYVRIPIAGSGNYALGMFPSGSVPGTAYNSSLMIEYDPLNNQRIIVGADTQALGASVIGSPTIPDPGGFTLAKHAWTHQLAGNDQMVVSNEQLGNLQVSPSTTNTQHVIVSGGVCQVGGVLVKVYAPIDVNLSTFFPLSGVKYVWVTLSSAGAVVPIDPLVTDITLLDLPVTPNHLLAFVMLQAYQPITWANIKSVQSVLDDVRGWRLSGNSGVSASTDWMGSVNDADVVFKRYNIEIVRLTTTAIVSLQPMRVKPTGTAGIQLDANAATGNFTLSLSPENLTGNRRVTFGDADLSLLGGGTINLGGYIATFTKTGAIPVGTGVVGQIAEWVTDANTLQASTLIKTGTNTLTLATGAAAAITWTIPINAVGVLTNDGAGLLSWGAGGGGTPGGTDTQVQYNNAGAFGGTVIIYNPNFLGAGIPAFGTPVGGNNAFGLFGGDAAPASNVSGDQFFLCPGNGDGAGDGGTVYIGIAGVGGFGGATGNGGSIYGAAGTGGVTSGNGGDVSFTAGNADGGGNGGNLYFNVGIGAGGGVAGRLYFGNSIAATSELDMSLVTVNQVFTLPDASGTFALGTGDANRITFWIDANTLGSTSDMLYDPVGSFTVSSIDSAFALNVIAGDAFATTFRLGSVSAGNWDFIRQVDDSLSIYSGGLGADAISITYATGVVSLAATTLVMQAGGVTGTLSWTPTISDKIITLPDLTGTVALLETVWTQTGNAGTTAGTNFIGTTDAVAFVIKTRGLEALWIGVSEIGSTPGNARGTGAYDFQSYRGVATQVASGNYSVIVGGQNGTASGHNSVIVGGIDNVASGLLSMAMGDSALSTHEGAMILNCYSGIQTDFASIANAEFAIRATGGFRHAYDGSNYWVTTVSGAGAVVFNAVGASAGFTFSDSVTVSGTFQVGTHTLSGTAGGATVFAVTSTKTLTFTAANTIGLTFTGGDTTLNFGATNRAYTFPDTAGTVALLEVANAFTTSQTVTGNISAQSDTYTTFSSTAYMDSGYPIFAVRRARGSIASPTPVTVNQILGAFNFGGRDSGGAFRDRANIFGYAAENWGNATNLGTYFEFWTTTIGAAGSTVKMRLSDAGKLGILMTPTYTLDITGNLRCSTGFGCNGATPQTAASIGAALAAYATGAFGLNSDANMSALVAQVKAMAVALKAFGIAVV